ncbi:MAG: FAD-dependent oxidoreductase, partial [Gammaproteobacteria bacterium]
RFVLELIDGALSAGAVCVNYCRVTELIEHRGRVCGARLLDLVDGARGKVQAKAVVNTIGQWAKATPPARDRCRLTKGVHLIVANVIGREALLLTTKSDGRVFFMIPWYGRTLLGTTDTPYDGAIDSIAVETADVRYLLNAANDHLASTALTEADIIGRYAGLRVLKQGISESPSDLSRDWQLHRSENGVLTSIGGKFTSARADAAQIVDAVCDGLALDCVCKTDGRPFPWLPETDFRQWTAANLAEASRLGIDRDSAQWLIRRHGSRIQALFQAIEKNPRSAERIDPALPLIRADLMFCAGHEMVVHLDDLLRRRLPLLILSKMNRQELIALAETVAATLGWHKARLRDEVDACARNWLQH